jgi:hypothetical protein
MFNYFFGVILGLFAMLACFLWSSFVDGTMRREPSEWLEYAYLGILVMLLGYGSKYLDEIRIHPYRSGIVVLGCFFIYGWSAVIMWRKARIWDKHFHENLRRSHGRS